MALNNIINNINVGRSAAGSAVNLLSGLGFVLLVIN